MPVAAYVDGPLLARRFTAVRPNRLRSYVRPVGALAHERWPRWFPRHEFQTEVRPYLGQSGYRSISHRGSIDHTICRLSCKFWHQLSTVAVQLLPVSGRSLNCGLPSGGAQVLRWRMPSSIALRNGIQWRSNIGSVAGSSDRTDQDDGRGSGGIGFFCEHHLPGDARGLVGERYRGQFCWLALEKIEQPRRGFSVP